MALVHALAKVSMELIAIYFHSFEIFNIQIGEMAFCKPDYYQVKLFSECSKNEWFLDYFEARNLRSRLTVAVAKCYYLDFKKVFS
jgi:hypothetical protein